MKFIKLTTFPNNKNVFVNAKYIVMIGNSAKDNTEFSVVNSDDTYHVKESPEEILKLIKEAQK